MKGIREKTSLKNHILTSLILIILLQTLICMGVVFLSGATKRLDESTMQILTNTVEVRGVKLEEYFAGIVSISDYYEKVTELAEREARQNRRSVAEYMGNRELRQQFLMEATPLVLLALRESGATAGFMILENETGEAEKDAVYLRDINPQDNPGNNTDIYMEAGSRELLYEYGFTLDSLWTPRLDTEQGGSFYQTTCDAGNQYQDIDAMGLGNFSVPSVIHKGDMEVILYTVPLLDEAHHAYGVIGVEVSLDYLARLLPDSEITIDEMGSYFLGITTDGRQVDNVLVSNDTCYPALKSGTRSTLLLVREGYGIYRLNTEGLVEDISVSAHPLKMYNNNSPFEGQQWLLCGMARDSRLYASSRLMSAVIIISLLSSFTTALLGTFFMTGRFVRPIGTLVKGIKEMTPGYGKLPRTGIEELDEIAGVLEKKNVAVFKAGGKMAAIIDNSQVPLGVCDFSINEDRVFCTHNVFDIFDISDEGWENNYIEKSLWTERLNAIKPYCEKSPKEEDVWLYHREGQEQKWIQIRQLSTAEGELFVFQDITRSMLEKEKIIHDRDYDVLTNLYNRRAFAREMRYLVDEGHCKNGILSIWDLDNLKYANDTYGHDMGDKYIRTLATVFQNKFDVKFVCARLSGDEFTFFVYDAPDEDLRAFLEELHKTLMQQKLYLPDGTDLPVSASVGMARFTEDAATYLELMRCADYAMYQVKRTAKGNIGTFDRDSYVKNYILLQGVGELTRVLKEEAIRYAFQPIVSMDDRSIFAYEALIRPSSEILGRPNDLLRVAESQSRLGQIEHITWFHAMASFFGQLRAGDTARLFINSLPDQILSPGDFEALEQLYGDRLGQVVMEITESARSNSDFGAKKRQFCEKWNIHIALDDYGAGYSNSDLLMSGHFHFVKLDISLIHDIHKIPSAQTLVRSMIEYCHENKIAVIAEGIEQEEEYRILKEMGAEYGQGFLFARPGYSLYEKQERF